MKLILFFFLFSYNLFSQKIINISFGESIELSRDYEKMTFNFKDNSKSINLNFTELIQYKFNKPGNYNIDIIQHKSIETHSCEHHSLPDSIVVLVDSIRFKFIDSSFKISNKIVQNQSTENINLSVDVEIENYYKTSYVLNLVEIESAGVGTDIIAKPISTKLKMTSGIYKLNYNLKGTCNYPSYIQFDFKNHRGDVHSIAIKEPVSLNK